MRKFIYSALAASVVVLAGQLPLGADDWAQPQRPAFTTTAMSTNDMGHIQLVRGRAYGGRGYYGGGRGYYGRGYYGGWGGFYGPYVGLGFGYPYYGGYAYPYYGGYYSSYYYPSYGSSYYYPYGTGYSSYYYGY